MSRKLALGVVFSAVALVGAHSNIRAEVNEPNRHFTVRDSVEMAYFGTVVNSVPDELDEDCLVSPDGRYAYTTFSSPNQNWGVIP